MYSSLKYKGKSLYKYARKGITLDIKPRKITINSIKYISLKDKTLKIVINCGKGTYIRVLAEDIAKKLGTVGTLSNLRRIESANFKIEEAQDLDLIDQDNISKKIIPPGDALNCLNKIQCAPEIIDKITKGQKVEMKLTSEDRFLRLFDENKIFKGIVENCEGYLKPKRLLTID
jgi:tRNA pseudouridine55 synthase